MLILQHRQESHPRRYKNPYLNWSRYQLPLSIIIYPLLSLPIHPPSSLYYPCPSNPRIKPYNRNQTKARKIPPRRGHVLYIHTFPPLLLYTYTRTAVPTPPLLHTGGVPVASSRARW